MLKRPTRNSLSLFLCLCVLGLLPARALAWGGEGHRMIAKIAKWRLEQLRDKLHDPRAKKALDRMNQIFGAHANVILAPGNVESAAVWPDRVRTKPGFSFSKNLHFVSIPVDFQPGQDRFVREEQCAPNAAADPIVTEGDCSVGALEHFRQVLHTSHDKAALLEALSFVIHFVGDLHQPLHNSEDNSFPNDAHFHGGQGDRGGNLRFLFYLNLALFNSPDAASCFTRKDVCTDFFPNGPANKSLHAVWDEHMIATEMATNSKRPNEAAYAQTLELALPSDPSAPAYAEMAAGDPVAWAEQAHDLAEKNAYDLTPAKDKTAPADGKTHKFFFVSTAYRNKNIKNVDLQLQRAGIRLAAFLMDSFN
jgi:hypothetical protein